MCDINYILLINLKKIFVKKVTREFRKYFELLEGRPGGKAIHLIA